MPGSTTGWSSGTIETITGSTAIMPTPTGTASADVSIAVSIAVWSIGMIAPTTGSTTVTGISTIGITGAGAGNCARSSFLLPPPAVRAIIGNAGGGFDRPRISRLRAVGGRPHSTQPARTIGEPAGLARIRSQFQYGRTGAVAFQGSGAGQAAQASQVAT